MNFFREIFLDVILLTFETCKRLLVEHDLILLIVFLYLERMDLLHEAQDLHHTVALTELTGYLKIRDGRILHDDLNVVIELQLLDDRSHTLLIE